MTTNNNLRFFLDFYPASAEEESDSGPTFHAEGFTAGDVYRDLAAALGVDSVTPTFIDRDNETDESRYLVTDAATGDKLGVVFIATEEIL